jgi:hypothetical protein
MTPNSIDEKLKTLLNKSNVEGLVMEPCPLCKKEVSKAFIGNNYTKKRSIEIKCRPCNLTMKMSALRFSHEWLDEQITTTWNNRAL